MRKLLNFKNRFKRLQTDLLSSKAEAEVEVEEDAQFFEFLFFK
jgi:hypothetical protein